MGVRLILSFNRDTVPYPTLHRNLFRIPLCPPADTDRVVKGFVDFCLHKIKVSNVIWVNLDHRTQAVLTQSLSWTALAATSEQRINPGDVTRVRTSRHVAKKLSSAKVLLSIGVSSE